MKGISTRFAVRNIDNGEFASEVDSNSHKDPNHSWKWITTYTGARWGGQVVPVENESDNISCKIFYFKRDAMKACKQLSVLGGNNPSNLEVVRLIIKKIQKASIEPIKRKKS